jgi:hypothetical protein
VSQKNIALDQGMLAEIEPQLCFTRAGVTAMAWEAVCRKNRQHIAAEVYRLRSEHARGKRESDESEFRGDRHAGWASERE